MPSLKQVCLPVSKSLYIRKLICDFLKCRPLDEVDDGFPADVLIVRDCLARIAEAESGQNPADKPVCIDVRDCGAAYRFLMAVLAITPGQWLLTGTERLLHRPIEELVEALRSIGADVQYCPRRDEACPVSTDMEYVGFWLIHGKTLHASEMTIDCTRSGQFATALLLIADKIGLQELHIQPERPSSVAYIDMTKAVIKGEADLTPQRLGDWSAAVYWYARLLLSRQKANGQLSAGVTSDDPPASKGETIPDSYKLLRLDLHSIQSDAVLVRWFSEWGIVSRQEEDGVVISYNECFIKRQEVIELDMSQNVDLVPVLACMACLWPKKLIFNGVANLKYKESDRLQIIQKQLSTFADVELNAYNGVVDNQLVINPRRDRACPVSDSGGALSHRDRACPVSTGCSNGNNANCSGAGFVFDAHNDHRFVMGFSLFSLRGMVYVKGFDSVKKSYPNFYAEGVVGGTDIVG